MDERRCLFSLLIASLFFAASFAQRLDVLSSDASKECLKEDTDKSILAISVGLVLIAGITASYVPQFISLIRAKSSAGLNWTTYLISILSSNCNLLNALLLHWETFICCRFVRFLTCNEDLLFFYQLAIGWVNLVPLYILILRYFPDSKRSRSFLLALLSFIAYLLLVLLGVTGAGLVLIWTTGPNSEEVSLLGEALGVVSALLNLVMWTPQIFTTWRNKTGGQQSVFMLLLQAPGAILVAVFQAFGYHSGITTYGPYICTGAQQFILMFQIIYYDYIMKEPEPEIGGSLYEVLSEDPDSQEPNLVECAVEDDDLPR